MAADSNPILIIGAGLTGSLTALALMKWRPDVEFILIEQGSRFGGGSVLPFFLSSVPLASGSLIDPLIVRDWSGYRVAGPGFNTTSLGRAAYLVPEQIHAEILQTVPAHRYILGGKAVSLEGGTVSMVDGRTFRGSVVLDMRGNARRAQSGTAWRQTTSRLLRFIEPHNLDRPILADATFAGSEWTFLQYCPIDAETLLVQYVGYSHDPTQRPIDPGPLESEGGQPIEETVHIERLLGDAGPAPAAGDTAPILAQATDAELWNPILSSSVAGATRIAKAIADAPVKSGEALRTGIEKLRARDRDYRRQCGFLIELLCSDDPTVRSSTLGALYDLGKETVGRFEASDASTEDLARLSESVGGPGSRQLL